MSAAFPDLPALRCLGSLGNVRPIIVVDTREQDPLPFVGLNAERGSLATGDYSYRGGEELFAVERKTIPDLVACCMGSNRDRFFRELHRLRGFRFKRLVIVGTIAQIEAGEYHSAIPSAAVLATLAAIEARFDVPVAFFDTPTSAARKIESWAYWHAREAVETVNTIARAYGLTKPGPTPRSVPAV